MNQKAFVLWSDAEDGDCVSSIGYIDVTVVERVYAFLAIHMLP